MDGAAGGLTGSESPAQKCGGRRESGAYPRILARASHSSQEQTKEDLGRPLRWSYLNLSSVLAKLGAANRMGVMLRVQKEPWLLG